MRHKDTKSLELLYEETSAYRTDFLLIEDTTDFDWEYFWQSYFFSLQGVSSVYESYELVSSNNTTDLFRVVSSNNTEFEVYVNYSSRDQVGDTVLKTITRNSKDKSMLSALQKTLRAATHPVMNINFRDTDHNTTLTGKLGNHSFSVMNGIVNSITQSLHGRSEQLPDILYFNITKKEPKKLELFVRAIERLFPNFSNQYTDASDSEYNLVYFF